MAEAVGSVFTPVWSTRFDGSDVGLSTSEIVDALAVDSAGNWCLSASGSFFVPSVAGGKEDVFVFTPNQLRDTTAGTYSSALYFDGSAFGLSANNIAAIDLPARIEPPRRRFGSTT